VSDLGSRRVKPWDDDWIEYAEPAGDASAEAVKADIEAGLDAFEKHKDTLLAVLRSGPKRGAKPKPFDSEQAWRRVTRLAWHYFWRARLKQEIIPAAERIRQLEAISDALGMARSLINSALQSDVGDDLCSAWEGPPPGRFMVRDDNGVFAVVDEQDRDNIILLDGDDYLGQAVQGLGALRAAAIRACVAVPIGDGRPKGSAILPWSFIEGLAATYRDITGLIPGAGDGPFSIFVNTFVEAVDRAGDIGHESIVVAIKDARRRSLAHAAATDGQSPFTRSERGKKTPHALP
jgi:hypothetical protein